MPSSLTVSVFYGTPFCVESNPTVTISPANPSAKRRQTITYTVTVRNNDTTACNPKTFDLTSTMPAGWTTSFNPTALDLLPSASATVSMKKTVPSTENPGTYPVDATATSGSYSATGTASATVKP